MGGTLKKYIGAYAIEVANLVYNDNTLSSVSTISFKDAGGNSRNQIAWYNSSNYMNAVVSSANSFTHAGLIPVATEDLLDDYDINDYQIVSIGTVSQNQIRILNNNNVHLIYNVTITNSTENQITVNCIKFKKHMYNSGQGSSLSTYDLLMYAYFLDTPIIISPNQTKSANIDFEIEIK